MKTFQDDIKQNFLPRYGALAEIVVANAVIYVFFLLLTIGFVIANAGGLFSYLYEWLKLSPHGWEILTRPWTIFTFFFIHDFNFNAILNFVFNMMWLIWIGQIYRQFIGNKSVWPTYLLGSLAGGLLFALFTNLLPTSNNPLFSQSLNGSAAGVSAIIVATATLLPDYAIGLMFIGMVRLKWLAAFVVLFDMVMVVSSGHPGGAIAQVGGAMMGYLFVSYRQRGVDFTRPFTFIQSLFQRKPKKQASKMRVVTNSSTNAKTGSASSNSPSQQEIDRILDKINAQGYDKLTKEEKQTLYRANQQ